MLSARPIERMPESYFLEARIFTDPRIFEKEIEGFFSQVWVFLGHECEAREPGNYFLFEIGGRPVVVWRDKSSKIRGFIDACRVCGGAVTGARWGKREVFRCEQDHAAYDLSGRAVEGEGRQGLEPIEVESIFGLIFGAVSPTESLREFLGKALVDWWTPIFSLDVEWELVNVFSFPTAVNWKAFMQPGDGYHVQGLHRIFAKHAQPKGAFYKFPSKFSPVSANYLFNYPPLDYERFRKDVWGKVKSREEANIPPLVSVPQELGGYIGGIFPNSFYSIRNDWVFAANAILPRAPERMVLDRRAYCRAGLNPEQKQIIQREEDIWSYPMGLNGQDDLANFEWQQKALRGDTISKLLVARYPGEDPDALSSDIRGDSEAGYRTYFRRWQKYMGMKTAY